MATRRKSTDWWEILLYGGLFILAVVFLFQLLKLWNSSSGGISNFFSSIPQALENSLAAVENALTGSAVSAITSPIASVGSFLTWLLNLPLALLTFIFGIFAGTSSFGPGFSEVLSGVDSTNAPLVGTDIGGGLELSPSGVGPLEGDGFNSFSASLQ